MLRTRVIPCLLLKNGGLVKTVRFKTPTYVGDPINAVKIFNDKQADELMLLDISVTPRGGSPDFPRLGDIANEAFMPMSYGGGLRSTEDIQRVLEIGFEKVVLSSACAVDRSLLRHAADLVGSQSVVVCIDVKKKMLGGYEVVSHCGSRPTGIDPVAYARECEQRGAGEIVLNSIDRDGTMSGYDLKLIEKVATEVRVPVVALGGASRLPDFAEAVRSGASAVAAGSLFVFYGKHRAVLINYPEPKALQAVLRTS